MYEYFEHTADVGLRVRAATPAELFADAGRGLSGLIVADLSRVEPRETLTIALPGDAWDYLLLDWLNELLYLFESRRFLGAEFRVRVDASGLRAEVAGEVLDASRHGMEHEVKAVTYHGLRVTQEGDGGWLAEVVLDI